MSKITELVDHAGESDELPETGHGAVIATSQPLATDAGAEVLRRGGNAVDAAVCAAGVLGVTEPMSTGPGGDTFALVWDQSSQQLYGLNGSGRAPAAASLQELTRRGHTRMPEQGPLSVTVPGALDGFDQLVRHLGRRGLGELLEPAVRHAHDGFEVTPAVASAWAAQAPQLAGGHGTEAYLPGGRAPAAGERFRQPQLAQTLHTVADRGVDTFYRGELGKRIADEMTRLEGWLTLSDLERHHSEWVEPLEGAYQGHPVYQLPPNGQGIVVLQALGMLEALSVADMPPDQRAHVTLEALKLAFADAFAHVGDPAVVEVPTEALLDEAYLEARAEQIGERATAGCQPGLGRGDTAHVSVVDRDGNACSLIHSLYMPFGANLVVPGTGVALQNRGALFSPEPGHPNALAPGKRPYHTIIPSLVFRSGMPWLTWGVVGGLQQPQVQLQVLQRLIDQQQPLQEAMDAPRFRWLGAGRIALEDGYDALVASGLRSRGHQFPSSREAVSFGAAQAVLVDPIEGEAVGASDSRTDGYAVKV